MVFNGDIGRVVGYDAEEDKVIVRFDADVDYDRSELDEITLAYAVTVHKSQGSEFPCVVMPILTQHYIMLYRNLIYTAVTRAKSLVVLVGTKKAVSLAVRNVRTEQRFSSLADRVASALPSEIGGHITDFRIEPAIVDNSPARDVDKCLQMIGGGRREGQGPEQR